MGTGGLNALRCGKIDRGLRGIRALDLHSTSRQTSSQWPSLFAFLAPASITTKEKETIPHPFRVVFDIISLPVNCNNDADRHIM